MTTAWRWYVAIIVPVESLGVAEAAADLIAGVQPSSTFTIPLSLTGELPATHYACATYATDEWLSAMQTALPSVPGAKYWRVDENGLLAASTSRGRTGEYWSWRKTLLDAGLNAVPMSEVAGLVPPDPGFTPPA